MKKTSILIFLTFCFSNQILAQEESLPFWNTRDFSINLSVALVAALLSFVSTYFFFIRQKRSEKKKQLSYDLKISHGLVEVGKEVKKFIKIRYKDLPTDNLSIIDFTVQNTGNSVIKNQDIRFSLESKSNFVDSFIDPKPEPEWRVEEVEIPNDKDKKLRIGHLEKDKKVSLKFIVSGEDAKVKIVPHNDEGDVEFNPRSLTKKQDDAETLNRFFIVIFLIIANYLVLGGIETKFFNFDLPISIPSFVTLIILIFGLKDIINGLKVIIERYLHEGDPQFLIKDTKNAILNSTLEIGNDAQIGDRHLYDEK
ncbi:MAG: hypothetical protein KDE33_26095 [Bacteroidetes bacterium]|nr:hypothetical protein [Bacteroidota bacterium]